MKRQLIQSIKKLTQMLKHGNCVRQKNNSENNA